MTVMNSSHSRARRINGRQIRCAECHILVGQANQVFHACHFLKHQRRVLENGCFGQCARVGLDLALIAWALVEEPQKRVLEEGFICQSCLHWDHWDTYNAECQARTLSFEYSMNWTSCGLEKYAPANLLHGSWNRPSDTLALHWQIYHQGKHDVRGG
jgi:hypothetical protein